MPKSMSDRLAELSMRARTVEDAVAAARGEQRAAVLARREQTRADAAAAADRVEQDLRSVGNAIAGQWKALQAKIQDDIERLKTNFADRRVERSVHHAADRAARLETDASIAIDYAAAAIEDAKLAVLDAVLADLEVAHVRQSSRPHDTEQGGPYDRVENTNRA
jgi:hypothetical protein